MPLIGYAYIGQFSRGLVASAVALLLVWSISHLPFGLLEYRSIAFVAAVSHVIATFGLSLDVYLAGRRGPVRTGVWYQEITTYVVLGAGWVAALVAFDSFNRSSLLKVSQVCGRSFGVQFAIRPKDCVLVAPNSRWSRGDIVYFRRTGAGNGSPEFSRIVGLPGDLVGMRAGEPVVNGSPLARTADTTAPLEASGFRSEVFVPQRETNSDGRDYIVLIPRSSGPRDRVDMAERRVPDGRLVLLRDMRSSLNGTRPLEEIPLENALGKPVMVSRSPDWIRFGLPVR